MPTNHGTGANASVAGTSASTTEAASRATIATSSHGGPAGRGRASGAGRASTGETAYPPASATSAAGDPSSATARSAAAWSVGPGVAGGVGEVLLDARAQLGAAVLGQHGRLGLEPRQPGPHLGVVQAARARSVARRPPWPPR